MAFLDIFKRKKGKRMERLERKRPERREKLKRPIAPEREIEKETKKIEKKPSLAKPSEPTRAKREKVIVAPKVLLSPQITEKATDLQKEKNQYVFKVQGAANKSEIKKAIEEVYGVDVVKVQTINVSRKRKRLGRSEGWRKGYKKAVVKIKEGQSIEVSPR